MPLNREIYRNGTAFSVLLLLHASPGLLPLSAATSIVLASSPNPAILGQPVTLTATLQPGANGSVTFFDGTSILGVAPVLTGTAVFTTSSIRSGIRSLSSTNHATKSSVTESSNRLSQTVKALPGFGFGAVIPLPTQTPGDWAAIGDFNGDGKPDVALVTQSGISSVPGKVSLFLGNGDGSFTAGGIYDEENPGAISAGDFNNDGKTDLAVVLQGPRKVAILLGKGDGTFLVGGTSDVAILAVPSDGLPNNLVIGDFNGDGFADIATANIAEDDPAHGISVLLGNGDGTFAKAVDYAGASFPTAVVTGDFNGDGIADLAIADFYGPVIVLLGNGDGSFRPGPKNVVGLHADSMVTADFNEDGKTDLVVTDLPPKPGLLLHLLLGNGDGSFRSGADYSAANSFLAGSLAAEDFNGDGHLDLAVSGIFVPGPGNISILTGNGGGMFTPAFTSSSDYPGFLLMADLNGDGRVDIVQAGSTPAALLAATSDKLAIGNPSLPAGMAGVPYTAALTASGGTQPYSNWQVVSGSLPAGLKLDPATGVITGTPATSTGSPFSVSITVEDSAGNTSPPQSLSLSIAAPVPAILTGGITPIYSPFNRIQPGSWVTIYGTNLAQGTATWNGDFPTKLGGVSVAINGKPGYLWYVSPNQINLQAPDDNALGVVPVVVTNAYGSVTSSVTLSFEAPSLSLLSDGISLAGVIPTPDGSGAYSGGTYDLLGVVGAFSFPTRPVKPGESLILYGTGFGPTKPLVPAGTNPPLPAPTVQPVAISIGGVPANVTFAGVVSAGLFQFNLTVPVVSPGNQSLEINFSGPDFAAALSAGYFVPVQ